MQYQTRCPNPACGCTPVVRLSFETYEALKSGEQKLLCSVCQAEMELVFDPGNLSFTLRDGPTGSFASKANKESAYRKAREKLMRRRQADHAPRTKLNPNFAGQMTDNWKDAQGLAFDTILTEAKGAGERQSTALGMAKEAASTYDRLVKTDK